MAAYEFKYVGSGNVRFVEEKPGQVKAVPLKDGDEDVGIAINEIAQYQPETVESLYSPIIGRTYSVPVDDDPQHEKDAKGFAQNAFFEPANDAAKNLRDKLAGLGEATEAARAEAEARGVSLRGLTGSGEGGRITKNDVERASESGSRGIVPPTDPSGTGPVVDPAETTGGAS